MKEQATQALIDRLCDTTAPVVYFPVRHHSPACAWLVEKLIDSLAPAAVLIEGPSDFNPYLDELFLDHQLPIAIYSYFRATAKQADGEDYELNPGAFYPFCRYSPEWVALQTANRLDVDVRFIDLPWVKVAVVDRTTHRYADAELRRGRYVRALCERLNVDDFDDLWDRMIECHQQLELSAYLERVHSLCLNTRIWEDSVSEADRLREQFMAQQIQQAQKRTSGTILVVTGGYHSGALAGRLENFECPGIDALTHSSPVVQQVTDQGIALTTYSYARLDSLAGYDAGMPSPGFYEQAWEQRCNGDPLDHQPLLAKLVQALRKRNQILSTADLIAVETSARALAALRGRDHVWRCDLVDAVTSSLIKDELEYGCESPFIDAIHEILRGDQHGQLAEGTRIPALVLQIQNQLEAFNLQPQRKAREVHLNLLEAEGIERSRFLHQLSILGIGGFRRSGGTDFLRRTDLEELTESWRILWTTELESSCIEAARYGTSLLPAVTSRLMEEIQRKHHNAQEAAELLVKAAQAGIESLSQSLLTSIEHLIAQEAQFLRVSISLEHLIFLFCFDEAFRTARLPRLGRVVREAFHRSLWLLELLGQTASNDGSQVKGMQVVLETWQRMGDVVDMSETEFATVIQRVQADQHKPPHLRGAAAGILWTIGKASSEDVLTDLKSFADPDHLGDFLTGLFAVARETAQRNLRLVQAIDDVLLQFGADDFQIALPSLRLAFTSFTPREKHHMLSTLFESLGLGGIQPDLSPTADEATATEALRIEERLYEVIARFGLEPASE